MSRYLVYALTDPRDDSVRYIGRSCSGLGRPSAYASRHSRHSKGLAAWLCELDEAGLSYGIRVLSEPATFAALKKAEQRWVTDGLAQGWPLLNRKKTTGGGLTKRARAARDAAGRKRHESREAELARLVDVPVTATYGECIEAMAVARHIQDAPRSPVGVYSLCFRRGLEAMRAEVFGQRSEHRGAQ